MTFALTAYKAYATKTDRAVTPQYIQYLNMTITAANTDTTMDFGTTAGTFWTAATSTSGAAAKLLMQEIGRKAESFHGVFGDMTKDSARLAAASNDDYQLAAGTSTGLVDFTWAGGGDTPTTFDITLAWIMDRDVPAITRSGSD